MTAMTEHEARILQAVEALRGQLLSLTQALIACRTDSQSADNPEFPSEVRRCHDIIAQHLAASGMSVERWEEPPHYPVTVGRLPGDGTGPSLAINGHIDVVPVGDTMAWHHAPWAGEIAGGKIWGRGAADMKAGVAAGIIAVRALREAGLTLGGDLWLHVVSDEEVVGMSTRRLVARLPRPEAVIVAEPTDLKIMPVEGGLVHVRIEVEGRESHAGNRYMSVHAGGRGAEAGINAIEKALKIVEALQELERQWGNLRHHPLLPAGFNTIMPGMIVGGPGGGHDGQLNLISNPGTCPNYCSVEYNIWFLPGETFEEIQSEIEAYVADSCRTDPWLREHPPRFTWKLRNIFFPAAETPPDHPFVRCLASSLELLGRSPVIEGFTAASELAWYAEQGVPGTIFGPGRIAQAHSPDEYVEIEQAVVACQAMALAAAAWCGRATAEG
jgi:acetylornithine deacetylase/succinyl-diaminopimelate desuccinylase family protein